MECKVGACYQWKAIGQCSRGDSCSFSHADAPRKGCGQRQEEQTSSPTPEAKVQADGKLPSKSSGHRGETPSGTRGRIPCRDFLKGTCMNSSCNHWHPPVCLNYKSLTGCACGKKVPIPTCSGGGEAQQNSRRKVMVRVQLPYERSLNNWVVYPMILIREMYSMKRLTVGIKTHLIFSKATWRHMKERVHR